MNANERFEYMAEQFYKKTGMLAPGKDDAIPRSDNYKQKLHCEWAIFAEEFYSNLFKSHVDMQNELSAVSDFLESMHFLDADLTIENSVKLKKSVDATLSKARGKNE